VAIETGMLLSLLLVLAGQDPVPAVRAQPLANLASYIGDNDYPRQAMQRNEQGEVGFALDVSPQGRVLHCRVIHSSGSAAIDAATCRIMVSRARFRPARNADGSAVPDTVTNSIGWYLP
jgi:periplasmic protein TonB